MIHPNFLIHLNSIFLKLECLCFYLQTGLSTFILNFVQTFNKGSLRLFHIIY